MRHRRFVLSFGTVVAAGCAGGTTIGQQMASTAAAPTTRAAEVRVVTAGKPEDAVARVASAFLDNALPVTTTQGLIIEAKLPREAGLSGSYEIVARAVVLPTDSGTTVRIYADETQFSSAFPNGYTSRIRADASGRAGRVWKSLLTIGRTLRGDAAKCVVFPGVSKTDTGAVVPDTGVPCA